MSGRRQTFAAPTRGVQTKKADAAGFINESDCVGLLFNLPPGGAGLLLNESTEIAFSHDRLRTQKHNGGGGWDIAFVTQGALRAPGL
jgi:hypothetical protein